MRICLFFHILFFRFYRENGGGGVMDLVYGSSSSLDMDCEVNFVCCYADSPISGSFNPVLLRRCFVAIHGCTLYGSSSCRMSTRRLPIIPFVSRFECTLYPVMYCLVCLWWPGRFVLNLRLQACQYLKTFSRSFPYYPPPATSIGYPTTLPLVIC